MKMKNNTKKLFSMLLCMVLIVAMALFTTGCAEKTETNSTPSNVQTNADVTVKGEGQTVFGFTVVDKDGNETHFEIHTDKQTVGQALLDCQLIEGEEGQYGLYVKTVNGITADYDVDATYCAFYVNGEYAMTGVDITDINVADHYMFKVEK